MRRKLLSIIIVLFVLGGAVLVHRGITGLAGSGTAMASLGALGVPMNGARLQSRKNLARDISLQPARLLKVRGQDVKSILREPELVRREAPTTIWQYRTDACVLDIYFTGKTDPLLSPVSYYEIRARGKGVSDSEIAPSCVRELARKSGRPRMVDVSALYKR